VKIAILGDAHLIADSDPYKHLHACRAFFKSSWPSFQSLLKKVNRESPDLSIFLGDLVDWFSPQNIAFGLDLLSSLQSPWHMTPGNHDLAAPTDGPDQENYHTEATRDHIPYWTQQGVDLSNRTLDINGGTSILLDSALSDLAEGTETWLDDLLKRSTPSLLFTHVPIDVSATRAYILSIDPRRSMAKYVLSCAPNLYSQYIENRIAHVFSAHLHFPGDLRLDNTRFHLCNMSITMNDPNRSQSTIATATMIEYKQNAFAFRDIKTEISDQS
jgi:predicted MPP superfamily phosphohydrolase